MDELRIMASLDNMGAVLDFVDSHLTNCSVKERNQISLAVEEIFVNIASYAYCSGTGYAVIRVTGGDEIIIEFEDTGKPFNPLEKEDPDLTAGVDEREIGGLGVYIVKNIMDTVEYRRVNGKNILVIKKLMNTSE